MNNLISHHHGTCDMCFRKNVVIIMFGYNQDKNYSICKNCFAYNIKQILYGFQNYTDGMID